MKLNILLVGYYGSVTEPDDHPLIPQGNCLPATFRVAGILGLAFLRTTNLMPASLRVASVVPLLTQTRLGYALALPDVGGQPNMLDAYLGTVSGEEFGAILARHVTAAQSVAEKQFTQPRDNAAGLNLF